MPRFKLTIEYNGTRYSGWQIQKNARTIQGEIDRAVRSIAGRHDFELYGSGRTDAGVHAVGQVAHLDVVTGLPAATFLQRLNDELPSDINLLRAETVPHRFHARHHAVARRYLYQIATRRTAFAKPFVWWVREPLDLDQMRGAAAAFIGMRDFQSFAASDPHESRGQARQAGRASETGRAARATDATRRTAARPKSHSSDADQAKMDKVESDDAVKPTLVLIERLEIAADGDLVLIAIEGSHFLWKMVRRIVGVLVAIGRGDFEQQAARNFLTTDSEIPARLTAPASGLFLERVYYSGDPRVVGVRAVMPVRG